MGNSCDHESRRGDLPRHPCAFFDFDNTLIEGDSLLYWFEFYYRQRPKRRFFQVFNLVGLLLYLIRAIDATTLKRIFFLPVSYEQHSDRDQLAGEFVHNELINFFYPEMLERVWAHYLLNHRVVVISASPIFYLQHVQDLLPPCQIIGTRFEFPREGRVRLPRYVGGNVKGENKLQALASYRELPSSGAGCFAYSDHHSDRFLLEYTEFPSCVQPTRKLRRIAEPLGWPHIALSRDRSSTRTKVNTLMLLLFSWSPSRLRKMPRPGVLELIRGRVSPEALEAHVQAIRERMAAGSSADGACSLED